MSDSYGRRARLLVLLALVVIAACSHKNEDDSGGGGSGNPGSPTPVPPPSGVVSMTGNWRGTSDFQVIEPHYISDLTATFRQNDRIIDGNVTFTSPGWSGWTATFTGQLSGNSPESQFFGNVTISGTPLSGGGTCTGTAQMSGATRTNTLRWEAATLRLLPTGSATGSTVCYGDARNLVWILGR